MCPLVWKSLIILGLGLSFFGLILMIESKILRTENGRTFDSHTVIHPLFYKFAWVFTIGGYILQIAGVVLS